MVQSNYTDVLEIKELLLETSEEIRRNWNPEKSAVYSFLHKELHKGNSRDDSLFTFVYRSFYNMENRSITEMFDQTYFSIMNQQLTSNKLPNLTTITYDLYQVKNKNNNPSMQFSLVTNMVNTINPNFPTFDPDVAKLFAFPSTKHLSGFYKKMKRNLDQYRYLHKSYFHLLSDPDVNAFLQLIDTNLPSVKKLDLVMKEVSQRHTNK